MGTDAQPRQAGTTWPVHVATRTCHVAHGPVAFDCVQFIVVRCGTAILFGEAGTIPIRAGDVIATAPSTLVGSEPEGWVTTTTVYLAREYLVDQVFWRCIHRVADRMEAATIFDGKYVGPLQVLRLGEERAGLLMPWLDELAALCVDGFASTTFYRVQALVSSVLDVVVPQLRVRPGFPTSAENASRRFSRVRPEARHVAALLKQQPERPWTLTGLASEVHLSTAQLGRVFGSAFGRSPLAYLAMVRAERMAALLRTTNEPVAAIARRVGWNDPDYAGRVFRRNVGMSPRAYRAMHQQSSRGAPGPLPHAATTVVPSVGR